MWYAVYETATGRLRSQGSSVPSDAVLAAKGLAKKTYPSRPDMLWNEATADFDIPKPAERKPSEEFLLRFTFQEHLKLHDFAKVDSRAAVWMQRMALSRGVDQTNAEFKNGMKVLVQNNIITLARAKAIGEWT